MDIRSQDMDEDEDKELTDDWIRARKKDKDFSLG